MGVPLAEMERRAAVTPAPPRTMLVAAPPTTPVAPDPTYPTPATPAAVPAPPGRPWWFIPLVILLVILLVVIGVEIALLLRPNG